MEFNNNSIIINSTKSRYSRPNGVQGTMHRIAMTTNEIKKH